MSLPSEKTFVELRSSDDQIVEVARDVVEQSVTLKNMLDDIGEVTEPIPLSTVSAPILTKVFEYCQHYKEHPEVPCPPKEGADKFEIVINPWDQEFCKVDNTVLFQIILAANFLEIKPLLDMTCKAVAKMVEGKTREEVQKILGIEEQFTPEELAQVEKENAWCKPRE